MTNAGVWTKKQLECHAERLKFAVKLITNEGAIYTFDVGAQAAVEC